MTIIEDIENHRWLLIGSMTCIGVDFREDLTKVISEHIQLERIVKIEYITE